MRKSQAKKLKSGDRVIWTGQIHSSEAINGTVIKKAYNTIWIKWDDGLEKTHYAETMEYVFTQAQLDEIDCERKVVEKIKDMKRNFHPLTKE